LNAPTESQPPAAVPPAFLDPQQLILSSHPVSRSGLIWYVMGGFPFLVLFSNYATMRSVELQTVVRTLAGLTMVVLMLGLSIFTWVIANRHREERRRLEALEELVQLRHWREAGVMLQLLLSRPTHTQQSRIQGLIFLTAVLARYHRYADAIVTQDYLLEQVELDPGTMYGLRLGRAMAMLHEDHLVDANRAISELRRADGAGDSGGLALVEIYRDVKTGHPAEAIELFSSKQAVMRKQLGHRIADAWALVAKAYDMVGHDESARQAYMNATLLAPIAEISGKFSEVASLTGKYSPATAPAE
jgi:hypothetical protein